MSQFKVSARSNLNLALAGLEVWEAVHQTNLSVTITETHPQTMRVLMDTDAHSPLHVALLSKVQQKVQQSCLIGNLAIWLCTAGRLPWVLQVRWMAHTPYYEK